MTVTMRRLERSEDEYIVYAKSLCGKATYFLYFTDGLFASGGTVQLRGDAQTLFQHRRARFDGA
jgi:hypothetical protein